MQQNSQNKISKKESNKYKKTKDELKNKKKSAESSDDDNSFFTDDEEDDINVHEYRKMLQKMFPSKYIDKKIKAG